MIPFASGGSVATKWIGSFAAVGGFAAILGGADLAAVLTSLVVAIGGLTVKLADARFKRNENVISKHDRDLNRVEESNEKLRARVDELESVIDRYRIHNTDLRIWGRNLSAQVARSGETPEQEPIVPAAAKPGLLRGPE